MRTYCRIETSFWQNPKVRALSCDEARHLPLYLYICPHGNSLGCLVLPDGYIMADLNWPFETLSERFLELSAKGFVERDQASSLVRILGWFGHNRIENKNVAQGAVKIIAALPRGDILNNLLADLNEIDNKFLTPLLSRSANRSDRVSNESESPEPEPEPNPELNPDPEQAVAPGAPPSAKRHGERKGAMPAEDWAPTPDDIAFAAAAGLAVPAIHAEAEKFKDYWIAVPGARGRKLDWLATWKNWIRRCVEQLTAHPPGPLATPDPLAHWGEEESHANH
ncbi:MAG: hypothetical protein QF666_04220 [Alphaproteobacteria bacterium]|nr:hypothetical protein [Alphaproteobacteria bacterium]